MKKIIFVFSCVAMASAINSQTTWNQTLNTVPGNPFLGTINNKPINFFTNNTMWMTLSTLGKLTLNDLGGTGNRFLQVDATGQLLAWTGTSGYSDYVLYGDGTWKLPPVRTSGSYAYIPTSTKFGIGNATPAVELDVTGKGNITSDLSVGGGITSTNGMTVLNRVKMDVTAGSSGNPDILAFRPNGTPSGGSSYPVATFQRPCNVFYTNIAVNTQKGVGWTVTWGPPNTNIFYNLMQIYESASPKSTLSMGIIGGDGVIALEPLSSNSNLQTLKINPGCNADVSICEGGGFTRVFGNQNVAGSFRAGPGNYVTGNSQFDLYLDTWATNAMTIVDPALSTAGKNVVQISKSGKIILGVDVQPISGSMLTVGQSVKTVPGISLMDNSVSPNLPIFNVYGDGKTEINTSNADALIVKNSSGGICHNI